MNFIADIEKNLESLRNKLIMDYLQLYVSGLDLPEVGEDGFCVDDRSIYNTFSKGTESHKVIKSSLDPKTDPNRWFDYNMVVGTGNSRSVMMDRYNPEGYYYFLTEKEIKEFKRRNKPLFREWDI